MILLRGPNELQLHYTGVTAMSQSITQNVSC